MVTKDLRSRSRQNSTRIRDAVKHRNDKGEGGYKTNDDGRNQSPWDGWYSVLAILSQMDGTIEPGVHEGGIDKTGEEDNAVRWPTRLIYESCPDKLTGILRTGNCETSNEECEKAEERDGN